jgi:hypothetical protein
MNGKREAEAGGDKDLGIETSCDETSAAVLKAA